MTASKAQLEASRKYDQKFDKFLVRLPSGEKEIVTAHAKTTGESLNGFVRRAIHETIERDSNK